MLLRGKEPKLLDKLREAFVASERDVAERARHLVDALPEGESKALTRRLAQAHELMGRNRREGLETFKASGLDPSAGEQGRRFAVVASEVRSLASRAQGSGVDRVGQAVGLMDQATQRSAALVEECAAAAQSLRLQAHKLAQAVAVFRLGAGLIAGRRPVMRLRPG